MRSRKLGSFCLQAWISSEGTSGNGLSGMAGCFVRRRIGSMQSIHNPQPFL
jgi:hypothetical protein